MGLILAAAASVSSVLGDQWKEFFYCKDMGQEVLARKGERNHGKTGLMNRGGSDNVITDGSTVVVSDGQCLIIVDQGAVADVCAEPGVYTYQTGTSPSLFSGNLGEGIKNTFSELVGRVAAGGVTSKDQRIYYFNTRNIMGNKYGTASPVPFRVVDRNIGLDVDISVKCFGEYSYRISDPLLFYKNISGNVDGDFTRDRIASQLKSELLTALQPAFARISDMGIRYSSLPGHTSEMSQVLNEELSSKWGQVYGIQIVTFGVNSVKASEEDEKMIKELQKNAVYRNAEMGAAALVGAQAQAMQDAAKNPNGAMMGFAGLNMAQQAGGFNAQSLYQMGAQQAQQSQQPPQMQPAGAWICTNCGQQGNTGKFCSNCGSPKPADNGAWICTNCGQQGNTGKFCSNCGSPKPADNGAWICTNCGQQGNTGKFCGNCGSPRP